MSALLIARSAASRLQEVSNIVNCVGCALGDHLVAGRNDDLFIWIESIPRVFASAWKLGCLFLEGNDPALCFVWCVRVRVPVRSVKTCVEPRHGSSPTFILYLAGNSMLKFDVFS